MAVQDTIDDDYVAVVWRDDGQDEKHVSTHLDADNNVIAFPLDSPETSGARYVPTIKGAEAALSHPGKVCVPGTVATELFAGRKFNVAE